MSEEASLILNVQSDGVTQASKRLRTFARDGKVAEKSITGLSGESTKTSNALGKVSTSGTSASQSLTKVAREGVKADRSLGTVSRAANSAGIAFKSMIVGAVGVTAISAIVGKATREWLSYDKAIKEVNSITDQTAGEFKTMRKDVLNLSAALGVDATNAAKGLYQALSSGIPKENAIEFLKVASKAAIAGVTDVGTAVDGLTNTINAFKIPVGDAETVADKLFSTVVQGKTTFEELSRNMSKASVPAAALGIDLDELLGVVVGITKQGTPTSEAFTQIKASIQALTNPADEMLAVFNQMGVATGREAIAKFGLVETLNRLEVAYRGNDAALFKALRSSEALNGVLSVTGTNLESTKTAVDGVTTATGKMGGAFKENANTLENSLTSLKASSVLLVEQMEGSFGIIQSFTSLLKSAAVQIAEFSGETFSVDTQTILDNPQQTVQNLEDISSRLKELKNTVKSQKKELDNSNKFLRMSPVGLVRHGRKVGDFNRNVSEIDALQKAYSGVNEQLRLQYETQQRIEEVRNREGAVQESVLVYEEFQNESLIKSLIKIREKIELEAIQEQEKEKAHSAQQERVKAVSEQEEKEKKFAEEKAKAEKKAAEAKAKADAQALANAIKINTTQKEAIQLEIDKYRGYVKSDPANEEIYNKTIGKLEKEIELLDERNNKISTSGKSPEASAFGGGGFQPAYQPLPQMYDPFRSQNQFDELDRQVDQIRQSYMERKEAILSITSTTEEEKRRLIQESEKELDRILDRADRERNIARLQLASDFFGNLSQAASAFGKKGAKIAKAAAITQTIIKTYESATSAYASLAGIPYIGPALGAAAAGAAISAGFANVQAIRSQPVDAGAYATGGIVGGNQTSGDQMNARVNSKEMILNMGQQQRLFNIANGKESANNGGSSQPILNFNIRTMAGTTAEVKQNANDPKQFEIIMRKMDEKLASDLQTGDGKFVPALTKRVPSLKQAT